jgi:hypothetical protein
VNHEKPLKKQKRGHEKPRLGVFGIADQPGTIARQRLEKPGSRSRGGCRHGCPGELAVR